jgi:hypothetical protein
VTESDSVSPADRPERQRSRRADILALVGLAALVTLFFSDVLFGLSRFYTRDLAQYYVPTKTIIRELVLAGEFPWWNPYYAAGQPMAANPEYEIFYPLQWLIFLPDFELGYKLHVLLHIYLIVCTSFLLLRSFRLGIPASLFGAISWGLGGVAISMINLLPMLFAVAWMPLIFLFARRLLSSFRKSDAAAFVLFAGVQILVGEPTTLIQTWLILGGYAVWTIWRRSRWGPSPWRVFLIFVLLFLWSVAIGSVQLIPAIDHVRDTERARGLAYEEVMGWSFPPVRILELSHPFLFGYIDDEGRMAWWGRTLYEQRRSPFILRIYSGALLIPLLIAGLCSRRPGRLPLALIVIPFLAVALGANTPLLPTIYNLGLPIPFRFPEKFMLMVVFAIVVFSSFTLDRILRGDRELLRRALIAAASLTGTFALMMIFSRTSVYESFFLDLWATEPSRFADRMVLLSRRGWIFALVAMGSSAIALAAFYLRTSSARLWQAVVIAVLVLELLPIHYDTIPRIESEFYEPPEVVGALDADRGGYRIFHQMDWYERGRHGEGYQRLGKGAIWATRNGMFPMLPAAWGFRTVLEKDYDLTHLQSTSDLVRSMWEVQMSGQEEWAGFFLPISNVRYVAVARPLQEELRRVADRPWEIQPADFVRVPHLPRYYFADTIHRISSRTEFVREISANVPEARTAFVDLPPFEPARSEITSVDERSSAVVLHVRTEGKAFLVLSVTPHKYWRATIDRSPSTLHVVNIGYQGIVVPPGEHEIELVYRNPITVATAFLSIVAMLTAMMILFLGWLRPTLNDYHSGGA